MKSILLVEDEKYKRVQIIETLDSIKMEFTVVTAECFNEAISKVDETQFDLLILDMSLPTYCHQNEDGGGAAQSFGGIDVLRHAEFANNLAPAIFITQYKHFDQGDNEFSLDDLREELNIEFGNSFLGAVYYRYINEEWKKVFIKLVEDRFK